MSVSTPDSRSLSDQLRDIAATLEFEASFAARPGQMERLEAVASRLRAMAVGRWVEKGEHHE